MLIAWLEIPVMSGHHRIKRFSTNKHLFPRILCRESKGSRKKQLPLAKVLQSGFWGHDAQPLTSLRTGGHRHLLLWLQLARTHQTSRCPCDVTGFIVSHLESRVQICGRQPWAVVTSMGSGGWPLESFQQVILSKIFNLSVPQLPHRKN